MLNRSKIGNAKFTHDAKYRGRIHIFICNFMFVARNAYFFGYPYSPSQPREHYIHLCVSKTHTLSVLIIYHNNLRNMRLFAAR
jgi:hypothetical protein